MPNAAEVRAEVAAAVNNNEPAALTRMADALEGAPSRQRRDGVTEYWHVMGEAQHRAVIRALRAMANPVPA